jgi:hypothetical protein
LLREPPNTANTKQAAAETHALGEAPRIPMDKIDGLSFEKLIRPINIELRPSPAHVLRLTDKQVSLYALFFFSKNTNIGLCVPVHTPHLRSVLCLLLDDNEIKAMVVVVVFGLVLWVPPLRRTVSSTLPTHPPACDRPSSPSTASIWR